MLHTKKLALQTNRRAASKTRQGYIGKKDIINREEMISKVDHRIRSEAKTERRRDRVSRVCPLGLCACALVDEDGDFSVTGGCGDSVTSSAVKTGVGASAGGKDLGFTRLKRIPG